VVVRHPTQDLQDVAQWSGKPPGAYRQEKLRRDFMSNENNRRDFLAAALAVGATGIVAPQVASAQAAPAQLGVTGPGRLTLHAIDTFFGVTGAGLQIDLNVRDGASDQYRLVKTVYTVTGGRTSAPVLIGEEFKTGRYELMLHLDDYFARRHAELPSPNFLTKVPLRFAVYDANQNFHVPVLFSPWGYSYYRGS
jgi:5-hydroxyisourate hydrolase